MVTIPRDERRLVWDPSARRLGPPPGDAKRPTTYFIKGPLQLPWLHGAAGLPGKALHIALGLLFLKGLHCSSTFPFKRKVANEFGVSRDATYDALTNLENAGLISVSRHRGRSPIVTVIDLPTGDGSLTTH